MSTPGSSFPNDEKKKQPTKYDPNMPLLKIDVKFELPIYNDELNAEKLDKWIKQLTSIVGSRRLWMSLQRSSLLLSLWEDQPWIGGRVKPKMISLQEVK